MTELEQLKPTLLALTEVGAPDIPIDVDFQEIQDLLTLLDTNPDFAAALGEVGLAPTVIAAVRLALPAARQAQSDWVTVRNPRKPEDQADSEEVGRKLRIAVVAALRFTLRNDRNAQSALDRIVQGNGIPDLVQDLDDLAALVEKNLAALAPNRKLDAPKQVPALRSAAHDIRLGLSEFRTDTAQKAAVDLRNRAWTWLETHVNEIRGAGRYAYLGTPTARAFSSDYERRTRLARKRSLAGSSEDDGPFDAVVDTDLPADNEPPPTV